MLLSPPLMNKLRRHDTVRNQIERHEHGRHQGEGQELHRLRPDANVKEMERASLRRSQPETDRGEKIERAEGVPFDDAPEVSARRARERDRQDAGDHVAQAGGIWEWPAEPVDSSEHQKQDPDHAQGVEADQQGGRDREERVTKTGDEDPANRGCDDRRGGPSRRPTAWGLLPAKTQARPRQRARSPTRPRPLFRPPGQAFAGATEAARTLAIATRLMAIAIMPDTGADDI